MIDLYLTSPDRAKLREKQAPLAWETKPPVGLPLLTVEAGKPLQPFLGVGAALTDSSAWLLAKAMDARERKEALHALFHPSEAGFRVVRICIGASDFAVGGSYTCCDIADPALSAFTLEREKAYLFSLLKEIRAIQPKLTVMATPWSAPAWMKTSKSLNGGWLDWAHYDTFARYLVKFLQGCAAEGIQLDYLTPQNEPRHESNSYPSMRMEPSDQARFIGEHLGPALKAARIKTKILCWDHNWDAPEFPLGVLANEKARAFTAGTAFHSYAGTPDAQEKVRAAYPDKELHFTESSGGDWYKEFGGNVRWDITNLLTGSVRYGARSVLKWNLILDEDHGPQNGGCKDCRGILTWNRKTRALIKNEEFWAFSHVGNFVAPGAKVVASSVVPGVPSIAFRNPKGQRVVVCCVEKETAFVLQDGKRYATVTVPAGCAATLVY
ncbi:MAG: glycoside hydrolase [Armatimonas sp.]